MTSLDLSRLDAAPRAARPLPRGVGLAAGLLVSLTLWAGLIRLALAMIGG